MKDCFCSVLLCIILFCNISFWFLLFLFLPHLHCLPTIGLLLYYTQNSADSRDKTHKSEGDRDRQLQKHLLCFPGWAAFPWRSLWQCSRKYLWSWWLVHRGAKQCNQSWHLGALCQGFRKLVLLWDRPALTGPREKPMWLLKQEWKKYGSGICIALSCQAKCLLWRPDTSVLLQQIWCFLD